MGCCQLPIFPVSTTNVLWTQPTASGLFKTPPTWTATLPAHTESPSAADSVRHTGNSIRSPMLTPPEVRSMSSPVSRHAATVAGRRAARQTATGGGKDGGADETGNTSVAWNSKKNAVVV